MIFMLPIEKCHEGTGKAAPSGPPNCITWQWRLESLRVSVEKMKRCQITSKSELNHRQERKTMNALETLNTFQLRVETGRGDDGGYGNLFCTQLKFANNQSTAFNLSNHSHHVVGGGALRVHSFCHV